MLTCCQCLCFRLHLGSTQVEDKVENRRCRLTVKIMEIARKHCYKQRTKSVRFNDSVETKEADNIDRKEEGRMPIFPFEMVMFMLTLVHDIVFNSSNSLIFLFLRLFKEIILCFRN